VIRVNVEALGPDRKSIKVSRPHNASKNRVVNGLDNLLLCESDLPSWVKVGDKFVVVLAPVKKSRGSDHRIYTVLPETRVWCE
jgi:hypothetical protein